MRLPAGGDLEGPGAIAGEALAIHPPVTASAACAGREGLGTVSGRLAVEAEASPRPLAWEGSLRSTVTWDSLSTTASDPQGGWTDHHRRRAERPRGGRGDGGASHPADSLLLPLPPPPLPCLPQPQPEARGRPPPLGQFPPVCAGPPHGPGPADHHHHHLPHGGGGGPSARLSRGGEAEASASSTTAAWPPSPPPPPPPGTVLHPMHLDPAGAGTAPTFMVAVPLGPPGEGGPGTFLTNPLHPSLPTGALGYLVYPPALPSSPIYLETPVPPAWPASPPASPRGGGAASPHATACAGGPGGVYMTTGYASYANYANYTGYASAPPPPPPLRSALPVPTHASYPPPWSGGACVSLVDAPYDPHPHAGGRLDSTTTATSATYTTARTVHPSGGPSAESTHGTLGGGPPCSGPASFPFFVVVPKGGHPNPPLLMVGPASDPDTPRKWTNVHGALAGILRYVSYVRDAPTAPTAFIATPCPDSGSSTLTLSELDALAADAAGSASGGSDLRGSFAVGGDPAASGVALSPSSSLVLPVFIQMFPCELQDRVGILNRVIESTCGTELGTVVGVEPRSETSFIAHICTWDVRQLIYRLRCRVLMDRHGFWYAENMKSYLRMKVYCEGVRRLPQHTRHFQTDGLPCMPLVVELSRSVGRQLPGAGTGLLCFDEVVPMAAMDRRRSRNSHRTGVGSESEVTYREPAPVTFSPAISIVRPAR